MNKIAILTVALLASAAFGEPSGPYMSYLGYDVGKSGSGEYSNYIGAYSGQYSTGISRCGFYGPASGQYGYKLYGCNGVGFYALADSECMTNVFAVGTSAARDADHCEDCIYIGKDAGRNFSHRKGDVVIGDVLIHTNGVTTIKGFNENIGMSISYGTTNIVMKAYTIFKDNIYFGTDHYFISEDSNFYFGNNCSFEFDTSTINVHTGSSLNFYGDGMCNFNSYHNLKIGTFYIDEFVRKYSRTFDYEDDSYNVYFDGRDFNIKSNGVKIAKFNTTPVGFNGHHELKMEDEDTGEMYIIKVKSGALKLYKVEETEE